MLNLFKPIKLILLSITLLCSQLVNAGQYKQIGQLQVHYIAIPSTFIQADTAKQYNLKRSKYNGLINISVLDSKQNNQALAVTLTGTGKNLLGQSKTLNFKEIKEGKAIYYLADYPFTNEEIVNFTVNIKTDKTSSTLQFQHKFYVE